MSGTESQRVTCRRAIVGNRIQIDSSDYNKTSEDGDEQCCTLLYFEMKFGEKLPDLGHADAVPEQY